MNSVASQPISLALATTGARQGNWTNLQASDANVQFTPAPGLAEPFWANDLGLDLNQTFDPSLSTTYALATDEVQTDPETNTGWNTATATGQANGEPKVAADTAIVEPEVTEASEAPVEEQAPETTEAQIPSPEPVAEAAAPEASTPSPLLDLALTFDPTLYAGFSEAPRVLSDQEFKDSLKTINDIYSAHGRTLVSSSNPMA